MICLKRSPKVFFKETGRVRNRRTSRHHLNYRNAKIDPNTDKIPGDLSRLAVTQAPVKSIN